MGFAKFEKIKYVITIAKSMRWLNKVKRLYSFYFGISLKYKSKIE